MSVLEFIGALEPWPASKRIEDVRAHKSRLVLQASALHAAIDGDAEERMLARACDRGAAVWEHRLLVHDGGTLRDKQRVAHSAVTLAERSGDWILVGEILATWRGMGPTHARFFREANSRYEAARSGFKSVQGRLVNVSHQVRQYRSPNAARDLLSMVESYGESGGSGFSFYFRGLAHTIVGDRAAALRDALAACVAVPEDERLAEQWFIRMANSDSALTGGSRARDRAVEWFDASMTVCAGALYLANERPEAAKGGLDPVRLIDLLLELERSATASERDRAFGVGNVAWSLARRGDHARVLTVLDETLTRMPGQWGLVLMRASVAFDLGRSDALAVLRDPLRSLPGDLSSREWRAAGRLLVRGGHWEDAIQALQRGEVREGVLDLPSLNDFAVALARVGREDEAQAILGALAASKPDEVVVQDNLIALAAARPGEMRATKYDPYAALVVTSAYAA